MNNKYVINIGRQLGSGGREIGAKLAAQLHIDFYDKELINIASKESGLCKEFFEKADEKTSQSIVGGLLGMRFPFINDGSIPNNNCLSNDALFKIQSDVIRELAEKKSCLFVGRCADYILKNNKTKIVEIKGVINKVADLDVPVLIEGETGTGKELIARSIHFDSFRKNSPFIAVNMAGIPENLIESELFGHEKGSFTGAIKDKKGKFELADNGTIFLDEIGEMNIEVQSKLLRVLQENEIQKVGSEKSIKINCRVVAATNRNLKDEIKKGTFREDLYYRLNLIKIDLPSLKNRIDDLFELTNFFVNKYARKYRLTKENIENYPKIIAKKYSHYSFPGNIRELENIVERFLIFPESADMIVAHDSTEKPKEGNFLYAGKTLEEIEKEAIAETLRYCNGNKTQAAKMLNIEWNALYRRIQKYGFKTKM